MKKSEQVSAMDAYDLSTNRSEHAKPPDGWRTRRTMSLWTWCCLVLGIMAGSLGVSTRQAQAQIPPGKTVLFAGDLNGDSYPDTVTGFNQGGASTLLPDAIYWGRNYAQPMPPGFITVTPFVYPPFANLAGSAAFLHLNPAQDNLPEIVLFLWGRPTPSSEPDTGRSLVIFGQSVLSSQHLINIALLADSVQTTPFYAQDLYINQQLTEPAVRDLSDIESYLLPDMVGNTSPPKLVITQVGGTSDAAMNVRIYPNPSLYTATVEATLPAGHYTARIIGVSGQVHQQQALELSESGKFWQTLDLSELASGYYMLQIERAGESMGAYPFIIRR